MDTPFGAMYQFKNTSIHSGQFLFRQINYSSAILSHFTGNFFEGETFLLIVVFVWQLQIKNETILRIKVHKLLIFTHYTIVSTSESLFVLSKYFV